MELWWAMHPPASALSIRRLVCIFCLTYEGSSSTNANFPVVRGAGRQGGREGEGAQKKHKRLIFDMVADLKTIKSKFKVLSSRTQTKDKTVSPEMKGVV